MNILLIILTIIIAVLSVIIILLKKNYDPDIDLKKSSEEEMKDRINFIKSKKRRRSQDWELSASGRALRDQNEIDEMELELSRRERREENKKSLEKLNRRFKNDQ